MRRSYHGPLGAPGRMTFGTPGPDLPPEYLWAFALQDGKPRVHQFPQTPEGQEELAQLLRSEQVVRVVAGREVITTTESLVVVRAPQGTFTDRYQSRTSVV